MMTITIHKPRLFSLSLFFALISCSVFSQNLLAPYNPGFENGYTGFNSSYNPINPVNGSSGNRQYGITDLANKMNTLSFNNTVPHTGSGMMVVDGDGNEKFYERNGIQLNANSTYIFSFWVINVNKNGTNNNSFPNPEIKFLPADQCNNCSSTLTPNTNFIVNNSTWKQVTYEFTPSNSGFLRLELYTVNATPNGNDFAIDDLMLIEKKPLTRTVTFNSPACPNAKTGSIIISANGGIPPYAFSLTGKASLSSSTGIFENLEAGSYTATVIDSATPTSNTLSQNVTLTNPSDNNFAVSANKTSICVGETATLTASGGYGNYSWLPSTGLSSTTGSSVTFTPSGTGSFTFSVTDTNKVNDSELIVNGGFETGNINGFTKGSNYFLKTTNIGTSTSSTGQYIVSNNSKNLSTDFRGNGGLGCTPKSGNNMFLTDSYTNANEIILEQTVNVSSNSKYQFSMWFQSLGVVNAGTYSSTDPNPSQFQIYINDTPVTSISNNSESCGWRQLLYVWDSGSNSTAKITIKNNNTQANGNDFALDDISFKGLRCDLPAKEVTINVTSGSSDATFNYPKSEVCQGVVETITPDKTGGTWSVSPATGLVVNASTGVITLNASTVSADYTITRVIAASGCDPGDTKTFTFKVKQVPVLPTVTPLKFCHGETYDMDNTIFKSLLPVGTTLSWTVIHSTPASTNLPTNGTGFPKFTTSNTGTTTLITKVKVIPTYNGCDGPEREYEIHVLPSGKPIVTCGTTTQTSITFDWNAITGADSYDISYTINNGASQTSNVTTNSFTKTGLTAGDKVKIVVTPKKLIPDLSGARTSCFVASDEKECSAQSCVNHTIVWNGTSGNPTTQLVCENKPIISIVYNLTGDVTGVSVTTGSLPTGITPTFNATTKTFTLSGTPNVGISGEFSYELTTVGCGTTAKISGKITVTAKPSKPVVTINQQTTCTKKGEIEVQSPVSSSPLIISEVTDANAGSLSFIELYNKSSSIIDMSQYRLRRFGVSGSTNPTPPAVPNPAISSQCLAFNLSGTIQPNKTYVIAIYGSADLSDYQATGITANTTLVNGNCGINTNDHFRLSKLDDTDVDIWGDTTGYVFTPNNDTGYVYRRLTTAKSPSTTWNPSDWQILDSEDYSDVGKYSLAVLPSEFEYSINGTTYQDSNIFTNLNPGTYDVTIRNKNGNCVSEITQVTINPVPANPTITPISDIVKCDGETINQITFASNQTGTTFTWTNNNTAIGLAASGTGDIGQFTATNSTNAQIEATITVKAKNTTTECESTSTFKIKVNPKLTPVITCKTPTQTSVTFDWSAVGDATGYDISYKITPKAGTQGSAITNSTTNTTFTVNSLTPEDSVEFTLTPKGGTNCFNSATQTCVAENCPTISNPSAKISICSDVTTSHNLTTDTQFTGANAIKFVYFSTKQTGNAMYSGGTSLGTATPSSGKVSLTIPKIGDANSIPATAGTYYIYAIANPNPTSASCRPFAEIEFEVKPKPVLNTISNIAVCNGETINEIVFSDNLTGSTYAWTNDNTNIGLATSGTGNIASFTATNTGTTPITATISVTATNNGCSSLAKTFTINVKPTITPIVDFSYTSPVCKLDTTNPTPIKASGFSTDGTFTVTSANAADLKFVPTKPGEIDLANTLAGTYDIKYEVLADPTTCRKDASKTVQLVITDKIIPVVEFTYPATVCKGTTNPKPTPLDPTKPLTAGGNFTVTSSNATDLKFVANSPGEIDLTQTKAGTYTITYSVSKTGCQDAGTSTAVTIEVQETPTISLKSANSTTSQEICQNTALTNIEYEILNGTGATLTITPATTEITGTYNATTKRFVISGTPTTKEDYSYEVETIGNCTPQPKLTGTIKVKEDDSLVLTSDVTTITQQKCINSAITDIVYTFGGGATNATVTGLPSTLTATPDLTAKTITISGTTPATAQTINYSIVTDGTCKPKTLNGTITVTDLSNQVLTFKYNASYCKSDTPNPLPTKDANFVDGGKFKSTSANLVFVDDETGEIDLAQTPAGTYQINYTVIQNLTDCKAGGTSPNVQVIINPDATLTLNSAAGTDAQTVCINKQITTITYGFGGGATNATVSGLPAGINLTIDTNLKTVSINGTPTQSGIFTYKVATTGTCVQKELTGTITVTANEVIETEFMYPSSIVCKNDTTNPLPSPKDATKPLTTGGKYTSTTGLVIKDPLTGEIDLATSTAGTYTVTYKVDENNTRCRLEKSSTFEITIKPLPAIPTITGGKTICTGTSTDITIKGDAGSSVVYSINGVNQGAVILNSNGEHTFSTGNLNQQTTYKVINVSHGISPLCTVNLTTNVQAVVSVQNPPTAIISQDAKVCINTGTQITVTGTPRAVVTYVILSGLTTTTRTITLNAQGTGTINTGNLSVDTRYRIEKVAITSAGTTCETPITGQIAVISINIVPIPVVPNPQYFCATLRAKVGNLSDVGLISPKWYDATNTLLDDTVDLQYNQTYYVTQTVDGCESDKRDVQVILVPLAPNNLVPEIQICSSELQKGVLLDTGVSSADYNFLWTPTNETTSSIVTTYPGEHKVLISSKKNVQNCGVSHSTFIRAFGSPRVIETITGLNKFEVIADGTDLPIEYSLDQIHWQTSNVFENLEPGDYKVYLRGANAKCSTSTDATVLGMPNVVVPDGKDKNQKWVIHGIKKFPGTYIRIYDRYGKLLKEHIVTADVDFTWDGTYLNRPLPSTSYWYDVLFPSGKKLSGYILLKNR